MSSDPRSLLSCAHPPRIDKASNETGWEEMAVLLRQDTNAALVVGVGAAVLWLKQKWLHRRRAIG